MSRTSERYLSGGRYLSAWLALLCSRLTKCLYEVRFLNGSKAPRGCVFDMAMLRTYICIFGDYPERKYIRHIYHVYTGPSLNFKKNKGTSFRRDFRRMLAGAMTFFNRARPGKSPRLGLPGPESNLYARPNGFLHFFSPLSMKGYLTIFLMEPCV